jgi:hypothetical protein
LGETLGEIVCSTVWWVIAPFAIDTEHWMFDLLAHYPIARCWQ